MKRTVLESSQRRRRWWLAASWGVLMTSPDVWARSRGIMASSCTGCHGGGDTANVSVRLDPELIEPGDTTTLVIEVSGANVAAAGLAVLGPGVGTFTVPTGQPLIVSGDWAIHNQPKPASGGTVEFRVEWRAPEDIGVARFEIAALATNGNNQVSGDQAGGTSVTIGHGCEPMTVYWDSDGDGFGRDDAWHVACGPDEVYSAIGGDCGDSDPLRFPGADERCNGLDDDCDGETDEGVDKVSYYLDFDQDGWGDPEASIETCSPEAGYVDNGLDCNDSSASIHPGSAETCDYVDNNCDGVIDEGLRPTCGVGLCRRVSEICGPPTLCSPGAPFVEQCNGLDDDCDGEVDEEGCPEGQGCFDNQCVALGDIPSSPPPTTTATSAPVVSTSPVSNTSPETSSGTSVSSSESDGVSFRDDTSSVDPPVHPAVEGGSGCHLGTTTSLGTRRWTWLLLPVAWVLWRRRRYAWVPSR